jgi:hypothetical protein
MTGAALAGAGVAFVTVGIVFQIAAGSSKDDAASIKAQLPPPQDSACAGSANPQPCVRLKSTVDDQHTQEGWRTGSLIAGGLLLAGGAALFLLSPPQAEHPAVGFHVVPTAAPGTGGVTVSGSF